MSSKRKRTTLSIKAKYEILQLIKAGETLLDIAKKYDIAERSVRNIKANAEEITQYYETNLPSVSSPKKCLKLDGDKDSEAFLYPWYLRCRNKNIEINEHIFREKVDDYYRKLHGNSDFQTSHLRAETFGKRPDIRKDDINEDFRVPNEAAVDISKADFNKFLQEEGYTLDNVYNADSTGLMWKALPEEPMIFKKLKSMIRPYKEQVTTLLCANATGCHKLPVLMIGTVLKPAFLKRPDISALSIIYKANVKPLMNSKIFSEWFDECFLKSVIERQLKNGNREKTLLLLDNAGLHLDSGIQNTKDEFVKIMYLPYDATPLIQPMDRGIITCFKRNYRKQLLQTLMPLSHCYTEEEMLKNYGQLEKGGYFHLVHEAWSNVNNAILKNAWNNLLKHESEESAEDKQMIEKDIDEVLAIVHKLAGRERCDRDVVINWFEFEKYHKALKKSDMDNVLDFLNESVTTEEDEFNDDTIEDVLEVLQNDDG